MRVVCALEGAVHRVHPNLLNFFLDFFLFSIFFARVVELELKGLLVPVAGQVKSSQVSTPHTNEK